MKVPSDLGDVPLEIEVPLADTRRLAAVQWEARLVKSREPGPRVSPTHAILAGIGYALGRLPRFIIGPSETGADLALPNSIEAPPDCVVPLLLESGRLWFTDPGSANTKKGDDGGLSRTAIEAGDRLMIRCGSANVEVLFAECRGPSGVRGD